LLSSEPYRCPRLREAATTLAVMRDSEAHFASEKKVHFGQRIETLKRKKYEKENFID